jgi:transposase-like protein
MVEGLSVAKTARKVGVSVPTAFAWRHKLLKKFEKEVETALQGIVEADETFFLFSEKGSRGIQESRKARKRGGKAKTAGISGDQVPVIAGCDRHGNVILGVAGRGRISMADIETVMNEHIGDEVTLCTDGHSSFKAYAKAYKFTYVGLNISQGKRIVKKKYHIQNVNNFHSRLKQWMRRFNGVSTKYLQNYMNWFSLIEETKNDSTDQARRFLERTVELS